MSSQELIRIRTEFIGKEKIDRSYKITLIDKYKNVYAIVDVSIQIKAKYDG